MAVNVVTWRQRLATIVSQGAATQAEVDRFLRWVAVAFVGVPILLGIIGLAAGWSSPFCAGFLAFDSIPRLLASIVTLTTWLALLFWIWRGGGADFLARVGPALGKQPMITRTYSRRMIRAYVTMMLVISALGGSIARRTMPTLPDTGCQAAVPER